MISSFISSCSFSTLFIKTNSSWLIFELIKILEIKTFMVINFDFASNTILSSFFFFFLIIDLYFLIFAVFAQIFNFIGELVIPLEIPSKEVKAEIEIHAVNTCSNVQYNLEFLKSFSVFYSSIHFVLFLLVNNFLFHLYFFNLNS